MYPHYYYSTAQTKFNDTPPNEKDEMIPYIVLT